MVSAVVFLQSVFCEEGRGEPVICVFGVRRKEGVGGSQAVCVCAAWWSKAATCRVVSRGEGGSRETDGGNRLTTAHIAKVPLPPKPKGGRGGRGEWDRGHKGLEKKRINQPVLSSFRLAWPCVGSIGRDIIRPYPLRTRCGGICFAFSSIVFRMSELARLRNLIGLSASARLFVA